jgi:5S rRNA maturation endonuclease (ribonuclease M5)
MTAVEAVLDALSAHGCDPKNGKSRCPSHDDTNPSLSVTEAADGTALLHCHAGCRNETIMAELGLPMSALFPPESSNGKSKMEISSTYDYVNEAGELVFQVVRVVPKSFLQRHPDGNGGWVWKMTGIKLVPYRLPELLKAVRDGRHVFVVEGEKDVDTLRSHGLVATCNPGGAEVGKAGIGKWKPEFDVHFVGAKVIILPDNDEAGRKHAARVAAHLRPVADVRILELPGLNEKGDVTDWLNAGHTREELKQLVLATKPEPTGSERPKDDDSLYTPSAALAHPHTPPALARDQDILARLTCALGVCAGLVGEDRNARLTYLAIMSQLLDDPVSLALKGLSSSGKSYTVESVLKLIPPERVLVMTAMSERALVYMTENFSHRTIVLYEAVALREEREKTESNMTAYLVRSLLSEGQLRYPVTVRGDSGFETKWIIKDGPTNLIVTTTATTMHGENETRMLSLPTNDSADQTRSVFMSIASGSTRGDVGEWLTYARWIVAANHAVVIPYAGYLANTIPPVAVRLRRDFRSLLRLIETHAILHQLSRETDAAGRIIATEADYLAVRGLVADIVSDAVGATVSPAMRETVGAVALLSEKTENGEEVVGIKVQAIAQHLELERSRAQRRCQTAREHGYIVNDETKRGHPARYRLGDPLPDEVVLLPERVCARTCKAPCTAFCTGIAGQTGVCACATSAKGVDRESHADGRSLFQRSRDSVNTSQDDETPWFNEEDLL